jgi:hypothetical protein
MPISKGKDELEPFGRDKSSGPLLDDLTGEFMESAL